MPHIEYIDKNFGSTALHIISMAVGVLDEYKAQGFTMTLRQLYYQFIARDLFPEDRRWTRLPSGKWIRDPEGKDPNSTKNADPNYKWMGGIVNDARLAGYIDWERMEDITRKLEKRSSWNDPADLMQVAYNQFHTDWWENQQHRPEIWIEKDALTGVIKPTCRALDVPYFSCRGYSSQSAMWKAGQRMIEHIENDHMPYIFHMGDHDPSGMDMSSDIMNRLEIFLWHECYQLGEDWNFRRIALNMDQINELNPPSDPAKLSDSRGKKYIQQYGSRSWELDALPPTTMSEIIIDAVAEITDPDEWKAAQENESEHKKAMKKAMDEMGYGSDEGEDEDQ